jgi:hypothetical protein
MWGQAFEPAAGLRPSVHRSGTAMPKVAYCFDSYSGDHSPPTDDLIQPELGVASSARATASEVLDLGARGPTDPRCIL